MRHASLILWSTMCLPVAWVCHVVDHVQAPLHWPHNDHDGVSNHQHHGYLLNRLFRRRSKNTSKLRVTGLCVGNSPRSVNSPHKGSVTRKMFPFDDVTMRWWQIMVSAYMSGQHLRFNFPYMHCGTISGSNPSFLWHGQAFQTSKYPLQFNSDWHCSRCANLLHDLEF